MNPHTPEDDNLTNCFPVLPKRLEVEGKEKIDIYLRSQARIPKYPDREGGSEQNEIA